MDLSLLRETLPSSNLAHADRELLENFKAAALSITTLYKSARTNSKLNYNVGYAACLRDVLNFVQAGVSAEGRMAELGGHDGSGALGINLNFDVDGNGMTIGRVMDWLESRLETITSEDDDAEAQGGGGQGREDDDAKPATRRDKAPERPAQSKRPSPKSARESGVSQPRTAPPATPTNQGTSQQHAQLARSSARTLSSSPPSTSIAKPLPQSVGTSTRSRTKADKHHRNSVHGSSFTFNASLPVTSVNPFERDFGSQHLAAAIDQADDPMSAGDFPFIAPELPQSLIGSKRRLSAIVTEAANANATGDDGSPGASASAFGRQLSGPSRRRIKTGPSWAGMRNTVETPMDAMDVEEQQAGQNGEPARKKVARR